MPEMDGYALARRMREILPGAVLVALSGWEPRADLSSAGEDAFDHYLTKPVDLSEVEKLLAKI
jgi:CheY-like chemotaxis protein